MENPKIFQLLGGSLYKICKACKYNEKSQAKNIYHASIVESAVNFWGKGMNKIEGLQKWTIRMLGKIHINHLWWTNATDKILRVTNKGVD